jgi:hypothetical protein
VSVRFFKSVYGVDFSGAKLAGRATWIAKLKPYKRKPHVLEGLWRLESLCGCAERESALVYLVNMVKSSEDSLWSLDFPFGLPVEIFGDAVGLEAQLSLIQEWNHYPYGMGVECCRRAELSHGRKHLRRLTDSEEKAPMDPYHYRIIYQTFHGMRDVLAPLLKHKGTAVLPYQYRRLETASRVVVEACPGSTLKRLCLPHQNYKQPEGGRLLKRRKVTRHTILESVCARVSMTDKQKRTVMRDPGADALDAVLAALGAVRAFKEADHKKIARHPRYRLEGRLFA